MGAVGTIFETKESNMKWFKRRLRNWLNSDYDEPDMPETLSSKRATVRANDAFESDGGLTIRLYKANGGRIVNFNHYDRKTDRNYNSVYIVTDEQDFERELGKMITMESMRG
jgi:hypothetical protein